MVQAIPKPPPAPPHLTSRAKGFWRKIASGWVLDSHHLELLRRCCEAMDRADAALKILEDDGLTTEDRYGQVKAHPCVNIERDARTAVARLLRELNLDEAAEEARPPRGF